MYAIGTPAPADYSHYDSADREAEACERKYQQDVETFIGAAQCGARALLPLPYGAKPRAASTWLTEPSAIPAQTLLDAIQHAMAGRDHLTAELLRTFVQQCAEDYAEDASE